MRAEDLLLSLDRYVALDTEEERFRLGVAEFVSRRRETWWQRSTPEGHVTASAWVVDAAATRALLLHHAKLDRWLQPGGHIDAADRTPAAAALRETAEETGLGALRLADSAIFDIDVHPIPARGAEPAHLHYDLRYRIIAADAAVVLSAESLGARWFALTELCGPGRQRDIERGIARMAEKSLTWKTS